MAPAHELWIRPRYERSHPGDTYDDLVRRASFSRYDAGRTGIDLIVVCDRSSHVAGIVTKTDVVVKVGRSPDVAYVAPLSAVMTRDVVFCRPQDSTDDVWSKMRSLELKNIPVVDGEFRPLGLLVARDVLQALLRETGRDSTLLRDYIMCVGYH
jgi:CBS domain-containing protein